MRFRLLLNSALKPYLLSLDRGARKRLREKLEFLENGLWDTGIRVKKLKGPTNRAVFEARLSDAQRLLFTLGRDRDVTTIHLWGIEAHDDVSAAARRVERRRRFDALPPETPFLGLEAESQVEYEELAIEELDQDVYTEGKLDQRSDSDYGPQKWLVVDEVQWRRILSSEKPEALELFLYLTEEQERVLKASPPLLLSGTAGSGKTTIAVYTLLRGDLPHPRLFLTYSPQLKRFSERIYEGLTTGWKDAPDPPARFLTFREMVLEFLGDRASSFDPSAEVRLTDFVRIYGDHALSSQFDAELVWEEIRSIVKGAATPVSARRLTDLALGYEERRLAPRQQTELVSLLFGLSDYGLVAKIEELLLRRTAFSDYQEFVRAVAADKPGHLDQVRFGLEQTVRLVQKRSRRMSGPLLEYADYERLGRQRAPNFIYDRESIYRVAEYYQDRLEKEGLWDEIDLTRAALTAPAAATEYGLVVCDEVQDFADVQLEFISRLPCGADGLVLTGDPRQIINPSGFRWEGVRARYYERGLPVPEVIHLGINFRCVGGIVMLANTLLDLKQELVGLKGGEYREQWKYEGKPPLLLHGLAEDEVLNLIDLNVVGRVVLTRTSRVAAELKRTLGSELVFTIAEAKGLEFDTVVLWKFAEDSADLWRRIRAGQWLGERAPHVSHEISLLYVAVTRARNTLVIYEGVESASVWETGQLRDRLLRSDDPATLEQVWRRVSTPEDWKGQADYFFNREHYAAAAECYRNAGDEARAELSRAHHLAGTGRTDEAAPLFAAAGQIRLAAQSWERAEKWADAAALWQEAGERNSYTRCHAKDLEDRGRWVQAAEAWESIGEREAGLQALIRGGRMGRAGERYLEQKRYREAAEAFEKAGELTRAAACRRKLGENETAAELYYRGGDYASAAPLFKKLKNQARLLACYRKSGDHRAAAAILEKVRDYRGAVLELTAAVGESSLVREAVLTEADRYSKSRRVKAAVRYEAAGEFARAGELFARAKKPGEAVEAYRRAGRVVDVAQCLADLRRFGEAAVEVESSDLPDREVRAGNLWHRHLYERRYWLDEEKAGKLFNEASAFLRTGDAMRAAARFRALGREDGVLEAYLHLDRDEEALRWLLARDAGREAARFLRQRELVPSLSFLSEAIDLIVGENRAGTGLREPEAEVASRLLLAGLRAHGPESVQSSCDRWLSTVHRLWLFEDESYPEGFLDLVVELPHYETLCLLLETTRRVDLDLSPDIGRLVQTLRTRVEASGDAALEAVLAIPEGLDALEEATASIPLNTTTWALVARSRTRYSEAVELLLEAGDPDRAARVCEAADDLPRSADILAASGDLRTASKQYVRAGLLEKALDCQKLIGSDPGRARVLEKMGRYSQASEIWRGRGNKREVARLERKVDALTAKETQKTIQSELFDDEEAHDRQR